MKNKYLNWYISIVKSRLNRTEVEVGEKHHIFPTSMFGKNTKTVKLTFKEHFVCHHLLFKACCVRYGTSHSRTIKMAHAFFKMSQRGGNKIPSHVYCVSKVAHGNAVSKRQTENNVTSNPAVAKKISTTLIKKYQSGEVVSKTLGSLSPEIAQERNNKRKETNNARYGTETPQKREIGEFSHSVESINKIKLARELQNTDPEKRKRYEEGQRRKKEKNLEMTQEERSAKFGSNLNKMWITNGIESITIPKDQIIPDGWKRGRAVKPK